MPSSNFYSEETRSNKLAENKLDGKKFKLSVVNDLSNDQNLSNANKFRDVFLKQQLQSTGIALTRLQICQWTPNVNIFKPPIVNTFYLGEDVNKNLNGSKIAINNKQSIVNYNTINGKEIIVNGNNQNYLSVNNLNNKQTIYPNCAGYPYNDEAHHIDYIEHKHFQQQINETENFNNNNDSTKSAIKELFLPIMLSGFGNMGAGIILDSAQNWKVFQQIPQLIVLVPALLGLKGNVEMTLSSRLGTCANLGELKDKKKRKSLVVGNVSLAQCQASTVGLLAPFIAIGFSYIHFQQQSSADNLNEHPLTLMKTMLILASSVMTSGLADLMLSSFMCFIVIFSVTKLKINADNIATPIAASIGDLATMTLFAITSKFLFEYSRTYFWLPYIPITIWIFVIMLTGFLARRNEHTSKLIYTGWTTLLISMLIQNTSGTVMENFFQRFSRMAAFQPVINGFGGNFVAVQSSRIATYLHKTSKKRQLPNSDPNWFIWPWQMYFGKNKHGKLALIMIMMAAPMQFPFVFMIRYITDSAIITPAFLITYYTCCTIQVIIVLYLGYVFVHLLWKLGFNPDNNSIPILTALADLIGSLLFASGFLFLDKIQDPNTSKRIEQLLTTNQTNNWITNNLTQTLNQTLMSENGKILIHPADAIF